MAAPAPHEIVNPMNAELVQRIEGFRAGIVPLAAKILNVGMSSPHNMFGNEGFQRIVDDARVLYGKNNSLGKLNKIDLQGKSVEYQGQVHGLIGALERGKDPNKFDAVYTMQAATGLDEVARFITSSKGAITADYVPYFQALDGRPATATENALVKNPVVDQALKVVYHVAEGLRVAQHAKPDSNLPLRENRREAVAAVFAMVDSLTPNLSQPEKDTLMHLTRKVLSRNGNTGIDKILSSIESEKAAASVIPTSITK